MAMISLKQLVLGGDLNPRKGEDRADPQLVASIKAIGLQQPLIGYSKEDESGEVVIIDGNRRLLALRKIHGKRNPEIEVALRNGVSIAELREQALASNVIRRNLHPVDEFDAYAALVREGMTVEGIADSFGVKAHWVKQRLQLSRIAETIRRAWRGGKINEAQAEAFSCVDDHARQVEIWDDLQKNKSEYAMRPDQIRGRMREVGLPQTDRKVKAIGFEAYLARGGLTDDDLFSENRLLLDTDLIDTMLGEVFQAAATERLAHGWAFVEDERNADRYDFDPFDIEEFMTEEERSVMQSKVNWEKKTKVESLVRQRVSELPEIRAQTGVFLSIDKDGNITEHSLLVRQATKPEDPETGDEAPDDETGTETDEREAASTPAAAPEKVNYSLREWLSEAMTKAAAEVIKSDTKVGLAALIASLDAATRFFDAANPLRLHARDAWEGVSVARENGEFDWAERFDRSCMNGHGSNLDELILLCSRLIDFRQFKMEGRYNLALQRPKIIDAISQHSTGELEKEILKAFDAEEYFKRIGTDACKAALKEMGFTGKASGKKDVLASLCAARAKLDGWLPPELRTSAYAVLAQKEEG